MEEKRVYKTIKLENVGMKILMIAESTLLLSAIMVGSASAQTTISSCTTIYSPGTYVLNQSVPKEEF
jgi:hypothetical protein